MVLIKKIFIYLQLKHQKAQNAWKTFADQFGKENTRKFLARSGDKMFTLYEELQNSDVPPHLVKGFEEALSSLFKDVINIDKENKRMEDLFNK